MYRKKSDCPRSAFSDAARGLFEITVNLGAAITIVLGIMLILMDPLVLRHGWLHAKLLLVAILLLLSRALLSPDSSSSRTIRAPSTSREFEVIHGMVSALLIAILVLTVLKPF